MKVKDLIEELEQYDPEAEMNAIAHNRQQSFSLSFGSSEGCTKDNCQHVSICLDDLNGSEAGE